MADHDTAEVSRGSATALALSIGQAGVTGAASRVQHSMPFVAQMIASACEPMTPYRRRKTDRAKPLQAYAALDMPPRGGTRRIV